MSLTEAGNHALFIRWDHNGQKITPPGQACRQLLLELFVVLAASTGLCQHVDSAEARGPRPKQLQQPVAKHIQASNGPVVAACIRFENGAHVITAEAGQSLQA